MANTWGKSGNIDRFYFLGLQNHCGWWQQPWIKRCLLLGRKALTKLDSIKRQRNHFANKGSYSQSYGVSSSHARFESWIIKKAEHWRIDAFKMWCWRRLLRIPWTARSNQSILKEISPEYSLEGMMLMLKLQYFGHLMRRVDSWERPWCWEGLGAGGEGDNRGWDGWMPSLTRWTWIWVKYSSWWWTGRPSVLQFTGSQRVGYDWVTELWFPVVL